MGIFEEVKREIRSREGCLGLEILKSATASITSIWTISHWATEDHLEQYRTSALFKKTWSSVRPLFRQKAEAWTLTPIETIV
jgi:quinol monooxygenase YgiN